MRRELIVTIDGPAGAGKSTAARSLAQRLGYRYLDTGAMYRAVAWKIKRAGVAPDDLPAIADLVSRTRVEVVEGEGRLRVLVDGQDVTEAIRSPEISSLASRVSALAPVRRHLSQLQRHLGEKGGVVAEGRDMGTVVFPDADVKFYLDASLAERARRHLGEEHERSRQAEGAVAMADIVARDRADRERALAPLVKASDAIVIDSTDLSPGAVVDRMLAAIERIRCSTPS